MRLRGTTTPGRQGLDRCHERAHSQMLMQCVLDEEQATHSSGDGGGGNGGKEKLLPAPGASVQFVNVPHLSIHRSIPYFNQ